MNRVREVRVGDQVFVQKDEPCGPDTGRVSCVPSQTAEERAYQSLAAMQRECEETVNAKNEQVRNAYADLRAIETSYEEHLEKICAALKPLEDAHATLCALRDEVNLQVGYSALALQTLRQALYNRQ